MAWIPQGRGLEADSLRRKPVPLRKH